MGLEEFAHEGGAVSEGFPRLPIDRSVMPEGQELKARGSVRVVETNVENIVDDGVSGG